MSAQVKDFEVSVKTSKAYTVPAGSGLFISGIVHAPVYCGQMTVTANAPDSPLGGSVVLTPCVLSLAPGTSRISLEVKNHGKQAVKIPDKTILCNLHQCSAVSPDELNDADSAVPLIDQFDWEDMSVRLTGLQIDVAKDLIDRCDIAFSHHELDLGRTFKTKHPIPMHDASPFKLPYHRIPPSMFEEVRNHLKEMLALDAIRVSQSPYASPVVLIRKPNGKIRFCIDFRKLNPRTKKDAYSLPRIDEMYDSLYGAKWFSSLDIKSAYWQVEVEEADKEKTAFTVGPLGFYECNWMPFGLSNAPATFQRLMESCLGDMNMQSCLIYLDDIVVFSQNFEEHVERLEKVFQRLIDAGLKLSPAKCHLVQDKLKYLGHIVSANGISTDPAKIQCVKNGLFHRAWNSYKVSWVLWGTTGVSLKTSPRPAAHCTTYSRALDVTKRKGKIDLSPRLHSFSGQMLNKLHLTPWLQSVVKPQSSAMQTIPAHLWCTRMLALMAWELCCTRSRMGGTG